MQSQWEEEASTTVEQGEVADKVQRALKQNGLHTNGGTGSTGTGSAIDEPTVDDQHAPVLSAITPIRPDTNARLLITAGNDAGQEIEIRAGKTWTIGRGLDNDIVLTDIAVSRKHFDLKYEDGAWIIVDRGSGNGTVVNGNVEDNPFMLASGDQIEIGNTVFRYEQPNGAPRSAQPRAFDDDEEMSTVAGKPVRSEPEEMPPLPRTQPRPKTMPPPVPLRHANASAPPPLSNAYQPPGMGMKAPLPQPLPPLPASTLPLPQMANRPPMGPGPMVGPGAPTMMGDAMGLPMPPHNGMGMPLGPNAMATTIPGQGPQHRPSYPYPQAAEIPPHSVHAQMLLIQTQNRRGDGSTAHVPPAPYDPMLMQPQRYGDPPQLTRRTKLAIAGVALALLTGIVTAAVVKSGGNKAKPIASGKKETGKKDPAKKGEATKITGEPIAAPGKASDAKGMPTVATVPAPTETKTPATETKQAATQPEPSKQPETKQPETKQPDNVAAKQPEPKQETKQPEPKQETKQPEPKQETKATKQETKRTTSRDTRRRETTTRREARSTPASSNNKRVAVASDTSGARDKAQGLYESKKFNDAASVLATAAKSASEDEGADLRDKANKLRALQTAYNKAMVPAQSPTITFAALQQAINLDAQVWGSFKGILKDKLAAVAPKAAVAFIAKKDYGNARSAYLAAKGSGDPNLPLVNQKLEAFANELYSLASAEASSNPGPAKEKLKQIRTLVDAKSPIAVKAQALLNKL